MLRMKENVRGIRSLIAITHPQMISAGSVGGFSIFSPAFSVSFYGLTGRGGGGGGRGGVLWKWLWRMEF